MTSENDKPERTYPCFIEAFDHASSSLGIPPLYRKWAGIYIISCAIGRRVWIDNYRGRCFPNLYVLMIGPPAAGKTQTEDLIYPFLRSASISIAPQHVTKAALIDEMEVTVSTAVDNSIQEKFHYLNILSSELVETLPTYDVSFLGSLARWWDAPGEIKERKRTNARYTVLRNIVVTMLSGVQPKVLAHEFPSEAWGGGFLSRTIFLYVAKPLDIRLRSLTKVTRATMNDEIRQALCADVSHMITMKGRLVEDVSFVNAYLKWKDEGEEPRPTHPRMQDYSNRREHQLEKLSIISAVSRNSMILEGYDFERGREWLEETEVHFEDIFIDLQSSDDVETLKDLQHFMLRESKGATKPVLEYRLIRFLTTKVPSDRVERMVSIAMRAGFIRLVDKDSKYRKYLPNAETIQ